MAKQAIKKNSQRQTKSDKKSKSSRKQKSPKKKTARSPKRAGKAASVWARVWKTLLIVLLVLILVGCSLGVAYFVTDGFGGYSKTFIVSVGDTIYFDDAEGLAIYSDTEVRVVSLTGSSEYTVSITARAGSKSLPFTVGAERYEWSDIVGKNLTGGFTITPTAQGFKLGYENFKEILASGFTEQVVIDEGTDVSGDLFCMEIQCGKRAMKFTFGVGDPVTGVELPDQILL